MQYTLHWMSVENVDFVEHFNSLGDVYARMNLLSVSRMLRVAYYVVNFQ
jgi:hypothetical protein